MLLSQDIFHQSGELYMLYQIRLLISEGNHTSLCTLVEAGEGQDLSLGLKH